MKLTKENIESYLIDLQDGKLNEAEAAEVFAFLELHPELNEYWESLLIENDEANSFSFLKKHLNDEDLISLLEGNVEPKQKIWLENEIYSNAKLEKDFALYKQTISKPDLSIVFPDKASLYKEAKVIAFAPFFRYAAIAASIVLVFLLYFLLKTDSSSNTQLISANNLVPKTESGLQSNNSINAIKVNSNGEKLLASNAPLKKRNKQNKVFHVANNNTSSDSAAKQNSPVLTELIAKNNSLPIEALNQIQLPVSNLNSVNSEEKIAYYPVEPEEMLNQNSSPEKVKEKNFWSVASGFLKNIRLFGAKNVQVEEKPKDDKTEYTFVLGNFSVTKTK